MKKKIITILDDESIKIKKRKWKQIERFVIESHNRLINKNKGL